MPAQGRRNVRDRSQPDEQNGEQQQAGQAIARLEDKIKGGKVYYNAVSPSFLAGESFVAMAMGYLRARPQLQAAAIRNPGSFLAALSDCARQGLVLGETYHIAGPFKDEDTGGVYCVGMRDYKGEIELMYRSGGVKTVVYDVIRQRDTFKRGRHPHDPPEFAPLDEGLASEEDRGEIRGAFAYAILESGLPSRVVVMGMDELMRHRNAAKTKKLWDGPWKISAYLKTVIHELRKAVPISAEFRVDQYRAILAASQLPAVEIANAGAAAELHTDDEIEVPALAASPATIDGAAEPEQAKGKQQQQPKRQRERRQGRKDPNPSGREPTDIRALVALMDEIGIAADDRIATVVAVLNDWQPTDPPVLTDEQHDAVIAKLREFIDHADAEAEITALYNWREWIESDTDRGGE
jgi:recombination protein RecT